MRITNKIMQNNNLSNINGNKVLQDKLSTQMSTQKKISRPSEDPVVAIRALRLRSNVTEVTQYYSKNIPDAKSWLEVTEGALKNTSAIITNMISQCTKGSNGDLTSGDREIILEQLKALRDEVYATGDADYAGRYVFTGFRTDVSLSFLEDETKDYTITQQMSRDSIDEFTYVKTTATDANGQTVDLGEINSTNYDAIDVAETDIKASTVHRIRLGYNDCKDTADAVPTITRVTGADANGNAIAEPILMDENDPNSALAVEMVHSYEVPTAYELAADPANADKAYFIPETGEILLGENVYSKMMGMQDDGSTATVDEGEIRITYKKDDWLKGDLRPEHYYACSTEETIDQNVQKIEYNMEYLTGTDVPKQSIEYDVGFNQTIRVNSTADECYNPEVGREVDDLVKALQDVQDMEEVATKLKGLVEAETDQAKRKTLQTRLDAANKSLTLLKDKAQKLFERGITTMQGYLDDTNLSLTNCGTRSSKLALIESRLQTQKTNFETLKSENEDVDITEVAIQLTSAELTYEAALMATGKVMQSTLMNFI
ncbi:MAG: hypothetical protein IJW63_02505 [Lachnospiraceae bacterium]|nr:hypothetical protein [Lachnospiraceae bacterium]